MSDSKNTMVTIVNLVLYHIIQPKLAERWLQLAHPTQPTICIVSVWFLFIQGSQEKKQVIPALETEKFCSEKST